MLPWEHAAIAYLLYSGYSHWRYATPPAGWAVLVVVFASQLPDLIDKPLSWQFGLLPSGRSFAHSIFISVPLSLVVLALLHRYGKSAIGSGFAIGHLSHLSTDAVPLYSGGSTEFESILWPLVREETSVQHEGFFERTADILLGSYPSLFELEPTVTVLVGIGTIGASTAVWILDGTPGVREIVILLRWPVDAV